MTNLRKLGDSELATPPLILGGNVFGWTIDRDASFAVLDAFVAGGGRMIDTADTYSSWVDGNTGGESETLIGQWLHRRGRRDDVLIATKVGMLEIDGEKGLKPAHVARAVEASLARLGTDYIDLYSAHRDDETQDQAAVADAFDALVTAGKVRVIGASNFDEHRLASALAVQAETGKMRYQVLQNQYNLLEREEFEGGLQRFCIEQGIGMTPYYSLASGYLTGKYRSAEDLKGKPRDSAARKYMEGIGPAVLAALDKVADETGASHAQIALAWLAAQPGVAAPIASATSVAQVEELLGAMRLTLGEDHLALLDDASETGVAA
jgi:aryl-alcohol dehydrogenase-like predicted oxidoreductase